MKYRRSLQVSGLIRLALLGAITAAVAGAFVVVKNRQHYLANAKGTMEGEIEQFHKQIETLELRIMGMVDRKVLKARLAGDMADYGLVSIEFAEQISPSPEGVEHYALYRGPRGEDEEYQR